MDEMSPDAPDGTFFKAFSGYLRSPDEIRIIVNDVERKAVQIPANYVVGCKVIITGKLKDTTR